MLFVGLGGLLFDNRPHIDPSAQDIANGYNEAYLAARVGTEFIAGVVTGGATAALGRGGQAARLARYGLAGLDAAGNGVAVGRGAADALQRGEVTLGNATQMIGGALGLAGNALGALGKTADDLGDAAKTVDDVRQFAGTKVAPTAAAPSSNVSRFITNKAGETVDVGPTLERIRSGGTFPHRNDGTVFRNRERLLPSKPLGYYKEYVHPTPGVRGPGPQRIIVGEGGELFFTPDHYRSFIPLNP